MKKDASKAASISSHPLIIDKLTKARDISATSESFRILIHQITTLLLYEACASLSLTSRKIETPLKCMEGHEIEESLAIVPILRAGITMSNAASKLFPEAPVVHIGLKRDESTLEAKTYFEGQLNNPSETTCIVLDPMLATGGTANAACTTLKSWGVKKIIFVGIVGAPEGLSSLRKTHPDIEIYLASLDNNLNRNGYIVPGLGDAGDRLFGTV